jgi:hypothetical protein
MRLILVVICSISVTGCWSKIPDQTSNVVEQEKVCQSYINLDWGGTEAPVRDQIWSDLFKESGQYFRSQHIPVRYTVFSHPYTGKIEIVYNENCVVADKYSEELVSIFERVARSQSQTEIKVKRTEGVMIDALSEDVKGY